MTAVLGLMLLSEQAQVHIYGDKTNQSLLTAESRLIGPDAIHCNPSFVVSHVRRKKEVGFIPYIE